MSIYATLWSLKFPKDGDLTSDCEWIEVIAQGVPPHIGSPSSSAGYDGKDPYSSFLPPPIPVDENGIAPVMRAVVFVTEFTQKATERSGQEYLSPLLVLTGDEYEHISFADLHEKICTALRGNHTPVIAEVFMPDGSKKIIRDRRREK